MVLNQVDVIIQDISRIMNNVYYGKNCKEVYQLCLFQDRVKGN